MFRLIIVPLIFVSLASTAATHGSSHVATTTAVTATVIAANARNRANNAARENFLNASAPAVPTYTCPLYDTASAFSEEFDFSASIKKCSRKLKAINEIYSLGGLISVREYDSHVYADFEIIEDSKK